MPLWHSFSMQLSQYMKRHGKSSQQIAEAIGVDNSSVSRYLAGKRLPTPQVMRKIKQVTNGAVTADDFYEQTADVGSDAA